MFVFEPVGIAFEGEDVGVVDNPVDHVFDGDGVADLPPTSTNIYYQQATNHDATTTRDRGGNLT